jgi:chorismate mutase
MNIINIADWGLNMGKRPYIISGPCSAETEDQVIQTALELAKQPICMLRAGIWKPRTRPNAFEGVGEPGLPWLKLAGRTTGLPVCVEVASPEHVELALKYGIDTLWIGARSTANPFTVQAIADALRGVDIPVFIKNPVNPDLQLWLGAIERLYNAGIHKIAAIHRGFSVYGQHKYRNFPQWEIPIELRRLLPNIEILCDPSHIGGKRESLQEIAQFALNLDFDGLMIESHINPDAAWSDMAQQITPEKLGQILLELTKPEASTSDPIFLNKLENLRRNIDLLDFQVLDLLAKRMDLVKEIGAFKKENNITILQIERWAEIFKSRMALSNSLKIDSTFIEALINAIHQESIRQQTKIMNEKMTGLKKK